MRAFILVLLLGLAPFSPSAHAADFDNSLAQARQNAAAGKNTEAIALYQELIKGLPKKDPRKEMLSAELVFAYYGAKDNQKTAKEAVKFLTAYPQSQYGFNISYILAAAQFGLDKFNEAFSIFSGFTFEQV